MEIVVAFGGILRVRAARHRAAPLEGMREGVARHLDIGLRKDLAGDRLELRGQLGIHAVAGHLALDDRHRHRQAIAIPDLAEQDFTGKAAAGNLGTRGKAVAVHVHGQQAAPVFGGDVRHRHGRQAQRLAQEGQRLHHPAVLVVGALPHRVGPKHVAAPGGDRGRVVGQRARVQAQQGAKARAIAHLYRRCLRAVRRHRHLEAHHRVLRHHVRLDADLALDRIELQARCQRSVHARAEIVQEHHRHALVDIALHPAEEAPGLVAHVASHPDHHAGVAVRADLWQRLAGFGKVHAIAQVVQRHGDEAHASGVVDRHARLAVLHHQHPARHDLDVADANRLQAGVGDVRDDVQRTDPRGGVARALALGGRAVIDRDHRQAVLLADRAGLAEQPVAIGLAHFGVALAALVPATVQRFERNRVGHLVDLRQDLETTVEDQLGLGIARLDGTDHRHHASLLAGALGVRLGFELVGIERVEEEATKAALPQRGDDLIHVEGGPALGRLVDHASAPGIVIADQPGLGNVFQVGTRRCNLANADVGKPLRIGRGGGVRIEAAIGLDHGDIERLQGVHRRLAAVVEGNVRGARACGSQCLCLRLRLRRAQPGCKHGQQCAKPGSHHRRARACLTQACHAAHDAVQSQQTHLLTPIFLIFLYPAPEELACACRQHAGRAWCRHAMHSGYGCSHPRLPALPDMSGSPPQAKLKVHI